MSYDSNVDASCPVELCIPHFGGVCHRHQLLVTKAADCSPKRYVSLSVDAEICEMHRDTHFLFAGHTTG